MLKYKLMEELRQNDLEYMVSPYVSIDQYTAKLNEDNIVLAFFCNDRNATQDLYSFLEKLYVIEIRDIEISDTLTEDNKNILYIELSRTQQLPEIIIDMIDSINMLINKDVDDWYFVTFGMDKKDKLTVENLRKYVRLTKIDEITEEPIKKELNQETVTYGNELYSRTFLDEGYISEKEMIKIIESSETFNEDTLELEVLEHCNPGAEIIVADENCFIIGDKIRKLRMM